MAAAVSHGQVDAAVAGPLEMALLSKGSPPTILADCRTEKGAQASLGMSNLPFSALMVRGEWALAHADIARRVAKATRRSLAWIQAHSPKDACNAMPQGYKDQDSDLYLQAVRDIRPAFSTDGLMPAEGPANVNRLLAVSDQRAGSAGIDLLMTYTNVFLEPR